MAAEAGHNDEFYLRLYMGHKSKAYGHEFMEFEVCPSGKLRYANNSNYKDDSRVNSIIRREVLLGTAVVEELKRIIRTSDIATVDDEHWGDPPSAERRQELEIKIGNLHMAFTCAETLSQADIKDSADPTGLTVLYFLTQDLKCFIMSLINLHFKIKPIPN